MRSWEVRLAIALAWLSVLPGAACFLLAFWVLGAKDPGLLFAIIPIVAFFLFAVGVFLLPAGIGLALQLQRAAPGARLRTALAGGATAATGVAVAFGSPAVGLLLLLYGGALLWLMLTPGAAADLGPWTAHLTPPAPWGSRPGTGPWSDAPAQQGPWSPDPRTLPWLSWKGHSGPRAPWWQTWQAGLAQGIPLWELVLLCLALLAFVVGLVAIPLALVGSFQLRTLGLAPGRSAYLLLLLPLSGALVFWLERRMRERLATRPRR